MRTEGRSSIEKSHSFGGYGPQTQTRIVRGDSVTSTKSAVLNKQDCNQQTWRLSPSSSGFVNIYAYAYTHTIGVSWMLHFSPFSLAKQQV